MKVSALLLDIDTKLDTNATETDKLEWINDIEQHLYRCNLMEIQTDTMDIVASQATYALTSKPYKIEDIEVITVDGTDYTMRYATTVEYDYSFCKSATGFTLYPTPLTAKTGGIVILYKKRPTIKTTANKTTEDLTIVADFGDEFIDLYRYYCYRMSCIANRDYADANTYATLYNEKENEFWNWYVSRQPNDIATYRKAGWR